MYYNIAIALTILSIALFFFLDSIIDKNTTNDTLIFIRKNNQVIAGASIIGAYLAYTESQKDSILHLPMYSDSINTSEALNKI